MFSIAASNIFRLSDAKRKYFRNFISGFNQIGTGQYENDVRDANAQCEVITNQSFSLYNGPTHEKVWEKTFNLFKVNKHAHTSRFNQIGAGQYEYEVRNANAQRTQLCHMRCQIGLHEDLSAVRKDGSAAWSYTRKFLLMLHQVEKIISRE